MAVYIYSPAVPILPISQFLNTQNTSKPWNISILATQKRKVKAVSAGNRNLKIKLRLWDMLQIFRLALCFIVGRGHDPADHLNNYEMLVFLCYSCGLQKPFTLEKFNRIGGVMTPPYEYIV